MAILICLALKQAQAQELSEKIETLEEIKEDEEDQVEKITEQPPVDEVEEDVINEPIVQEPSFWFSDFSLCSFYQNSLDTVFVCRQSEIYILSRDKPLTESNLKPLVNIYEPTQF